MADFTVNFGLVSGLIPLKGHACQRRRRGRGEGYTLYTSPWTSGLADMLYTSL